MLHQSTPVLNRFALIVCLALNMYFLNKYNMKILLSILQVINIDTVVVFGNFFH